jgi:hypothetical protein
MPQWLDRIRDSLIESLRDYFIGVLGGLFSGALMSTFVHSLFFDLFSYHEGWYVAYAPFLTIPIVVLVLYVAALTASRSSWRFLTAGVLSLPILAVFIFTRFYFPVDSRYSWIEFVSLWTWIGQLADIFLVASSVLFWQAHGKIQAVVPTSAVTAAKAKSARKSKAGASRSASP